MEEQNDKKNHEHVESSSNMEEENYRLRVLELETLMEIKNALNDIAFRLQIISKA